MTGPWRDTDNTSVSQGFGRSQDGLQGKFEKEEILLGILLTWLREEQKVKDPLQCVSIEYSRSKQGHTSTLWVWADGAWMPFEAEGFFPSQQKATEAAYTVAVAALSISWQDEDGFVTPRERKDEELPEPLGPAKGPFQSKEEGDGRRESSTVGPDVQEAQESQKSAPSKQRAEGEEGGEGTSRTAKKGRKKAGAAGPDKAAELTSPSGERWEGWEEETKWRDEGGDEETWTRHWEGEEGAWPENWEGEGNWAADWHQEEAEARSRAPPRPAVRRGKHGARVVRLKPIGAA